MRDVLQDLRVYAVEVLDDDVVVDLYGGDENVFGSIRFHFDDAGDHGRNLRLLQRWAADDVPVTVVTDDQSVAIVNDRVLIERALDPA